MPKISFFGTLKSNLKCAICKNKNCPVRFYPGRKLKQYYSGHLYITMCEKDDKANIKKSLKRKLP